jgi:hypothetical protein
MQHLSIHANPFALLVQPEEVAHAVAHSERLARLRSRVFRPLDRPLIPLRGASTDVLGYDDAVDAADDGDLQAELAFAEGH